MLGKKKLIDLTHILNKINFLVINSGSNFGLTSRIEIKYRISFSIAALCWRSASTISHHTHVVNGRLQVKQCNKIVNAWLPRVTSDLSVLASGLIAKNSALGLWLRALSLTTQPKESTDKSDITLVVML